MASFTASTCHAVAYKPRVSTSSKPAGAPATAPPTADAAGVEREQEDGQPPGRSDVISILADAMAEACTAAGCQVVKVRSRLAERGRLCLATTAWGLARVAAACDLLLIGSACAKPGGRSSVGSDRRPACRWIWRSHSMRWSQSACPPTEGSCSAASRSCRPRCCPSSRALPSAASPWDLHAQTRLSPARCWLTDAHLLRKHGSFRFQCRHAYLFVCVLRPPVVRCV